MARFVEITLWAVVGGALLWLGAAIAWHLRPGAARRAVALVLVPMLEKVRGLLGSLDFRLAKTITPISLGDLMAATLERLTTDVLEPPPVGPERGLISWNIPKTLPTASWRRVQVRVSRGSMYTADHRAGLEGGPPAYTARITVGTRIAVRLHTSDPDLEIDDLQVDAHTNLRERDLPDQAPRHWNFRIRSAAKGWRELSLIAAPLKPVAGDPFERSHAIEMSWTRLGAWRRNLPKSIKWAANTVLAGLAALVGNAMLDIARPHVLDQLCSLAALVRPLCEEPATGAVPPAPADAPSPDRD